MLLGGFFYPVACPFFCLWGRGFCGFSPKWVKTKEAVTAYFLQVTATVCGNKEQ